MKNVFKLEDIQELKNRINQLNHKSQPKWGTMNIEQMLAHCNVVYEMTYEPENFKRPNRLKKWLLKTFLKPIITGEKPYKKNVPTSSDFKVATLRDFETEKKRILDYIDKTQQLGSLHFEEKEHIFFGPMKSSEWNSIFYKHLHHHLSQFDV